MNLPKLTAEQSLGSSMETYITKFSSEMNGQKNLIVPSYIDFPYPSFPEKCATFLHACITNCRKRGTNTESCRIACESQLAPFCFLPRMRDSVINFLESDAVEPDISRYANSDKDRVLVTNWWHSSPEDPQEHLTIEVTYENGSTDSCHVYRTGDWTCFSKD